MLPTTGPRLRAWNPLVVISPSLSVVSLVMTTTGLSANPNEDCGVSLIPRTRHLAYLGFIRASRTRSWTFPPLLKRRSRIEALPGNGVPFELEEEAVEIAHPHRPHVDIGDLVAGLGLDLLAAAGDPFLEKEAVLLAGGDGPDRDLGRLLRLGIPEGQPQPLFELAVEIRPEVLRRVDGRAVDGDELVAGRDGVSRRS